jgi:hypothetical protein
LPAILGTASPKPLRPSIILHSPNGNFAIRRGPWKYIEGKASPTLKKRVPRRSELVPQLYNLNEDPGEENNRIGNAPEVLKQLSDLLDSQRANQRSR